MTLVKHKQAPPPVKVTEILHAAWAIEILRTALKLKVFRVLADRPKTARQVAQDISADERGVVAVLDALVALNFLTKTRAEAGEYSIAQNEHGEAARHYLDPDSHLFLGQMFEQNQELMQAWHNLDQVVKSGKPSLEVNLDAKAEQFFPALAEAIFPLSFAAAQAVASKLGVDKPGKEWRILDVASGSAVWSIPFAEANTSVKVDALDFPDVLKVTKAFTARYGVGDRYGYIEGNWKDAKVKEDQYDVILLGHILHSEGFEKSKSLIEHCFKWLKKGGKLVVGEFIANDQRSGPPFAMMFAVNMYVATTEGCVFSESELKKLLADAGFKNAERMGQESPVMIAEKA